MKTLTGIKDVDTNIINQLNDYDLQKVCQVNKYINKICNDDIFWMNRTLQKFGKYLGSASEIKSKNNVVIWQDFYKYLIRKLNKYMDYFDTHYTESSHIMTLFKIVTDNTRQLINQINDIKVEDLDRYLNENDLISYQFVYRLNDNRPDILEYLLKRSKTDSRLFPIWENGGYAILNTYIYENDSYIKSILEDSRSDPNNIIISLSFKNDDSIYELLKDPRITLEGIKKAMIDISIEESEYYSIKKLIPTYLEKGGDREIFRILVGNIYDNSYDSSLFKNILDNI